MICLNCKGRKKLIMPIYKEVPLEYIKEHSTPERPIAHFILDDLKTAKIPIGAICKKCVQKGFGKEYNQKHHADQGWRKGFNMFLADRK